jgi:hypothetical protein
VHGKQGPELKPQYFKGRRKRKRRRRSPHNCYQAFSALSLIIPPPCYFHQAFEIPRTAFTDSLTNSYETTAMCQTLL